MIGADGIGQQQVTVSGTKVGYGIVNRIHHHQRHVDEMQALIRRGVFVVVVHSVETKTSPSDGLINTPDCTHLASRHS
jgi:hypothetical protein